jgi:predicted O-methyltransferase YrrM
MIAAYAKLIHGLVAAQQPKKILEIGYGTGHAHLAIISACAHAKHMPDYTIIDPSMPDAIHESVNANMLTHITKDRDRNTLNSFTIEHREIGVALGDYISKEQTFDFIMIDDTVEIEDMGLIFANLLSHNGFLIVELDREKDQGLIEICTSCAKDAEFLVFKHEDGKQGLAVLQAQ